MRQIVNDSINGLVLLNKEPGRTSFQALYPVKRLYGNSVGHTGTLDLFAEGLLVVLVGKFTKFNPLFTSFDKVYEADFKFGSETDTLDPSGSVIFEGNSPNEMVLKYSSNFIGPQMQVPPEYSAIHVSGKRASDRVRDGEVISLPPRPVNIYSLDVLSWNNPIVTVRIHCSKGTYVRSVARDWGRLSGCGAHVTRLKRLKVGPFWLPADSMAFLDSGSALKILGIPILKINDETLKPVLDGRDLKYFVPSLNEYSEKYVGLEDSQGRLIAVVEARDEKWVYLFVDRGINL